MGRKHERGTRQPVDAPKLLDISHNLILNQQSIRDIKKTNFQRFLPIEKTNSDSSKMQGHRRQSIDKMLADMKQNTDGSCKSDLKINETQLSLKSATNKDQFQQAMDDFLLDEKQQHSNNLPDYEKQHAGTFDEDTPNRGDTAQFAAMQTTSKKYADMHQDLRTDLMDSYVLQENLRQNNQALQNRYQIGQLAGHDADYYGADPATSQMQLQSLGQDQQLLRNHYQQGKSYNQYINFLNMQQQQLNFSADART